VSTRRTRTLRGIKVVAALLWAAALAMIGAAFAFDGVSDGFAFLGVGAFIAAIVAIATMNHFLWPDRRGSWREPSGPGPPM
jgi:uncharacterized membrane protein